MTFATRMDLPVSPCPTCTVETFFDNGQLCSAESGARHTCQWMPIAATSERTFLAQQERPEGVSKDAVPFIVHVDCAGSRHPSCYVDWSEPEQRELKLVETPQEPQQPAPTPRRQQSARVQQRRPTGGISLDVKEAE